MTVQSLPAVMPLFTGLDGKPLSNGSVYIGLENLDPRQYPVAVFFDPAMTIAAAQPLKTNAGYLFRTGSPSNVWMAEGYHSLLVLDSKGRQVFYNPSWVGAKDTSIRDTTVDRFSGTGAQTAFTLSVTPSSENATDVYVSGVYQQKNTYSVSGTTLTFAVAPASGTNNIEVTTQNVLDYSAASASIGATLGAVTVNAAAAALSEANALASKNAAATSEASALASKNAAALSESQAAAIVLGNFLQSGAGAVARTFTSKAREVVSPEDFGAVGDGVASDGPAVQKALDTGKEVWLTPGATYLCGNGVTMSVVGTRLMRAGTLKLAAAAPANSSLLTITADRCTVDSVTVDASAVAGARAIAPINTDGVTIRGVRHINGGQMFVRASGTVRNLAVLECKSATQGYGVLLSDPAAGSYGLLVRGCVFEHPASGQGDGIEINAPTNGFSDFLIANNRIDGSFGVALTSGIGIGVSNCSNGSIIGNVVTDTEGDGIHVEKGSSNVAITGNTLRGCCVSTTTTTGAIAVVTASTDVAITGNTIKDTVTRSAIGLSAAAGTFNQSITITGNILDGATTYLVTLDSVKDCLVQGNTLRNANGSNTAGIAAIRVPTFVGNVSENVTIRGNKIRQGVNPIRSVAVSPAALTASRICENDFVGLATPYPDDGGTVTELYGNKLGTDKMYGTVTLTAGSATAVSNNNVDAIQNIHIVPLNSAARALGVPHISAIVRSTSFSLGHPAAAGTEQYAFRIL